MNLHVKILKDENGTFYVAKRDGVKLGVFASIDEALERTALEKPMPPKLKCPVNIWQSKKFFKRDNQVFSVQLYRHFSFLCHDPL